jgi:hypothetical protein
MLSYNYWMREEGMRGAGYLGYVRGDVGVAYVFTAIFGLAIMLIANRTFYLPGIAITDAQAVPKMAEMLGSILGAFGYYAYSVGFWAAVFASLLGVWQSVPYLYADLYGIAKKMSPEAREDVTQVTSWPPVRADLHHTGAIPLAFTGRPSPSSWPTPWWRPVRAFWRHCCLNNKVVERAGVQESAVHEPAARGDPRALRGRGRAGGDRALVKQTTNNAFVGR